MLWFEIKRIYYVSKFHNYHLWTLIEFRNPFRIFHHFIPQLTIWYSFNFIIFMLFFVLMTSAAFHNHVSIFFQNDIRQLVEIQHWNSRKFCRSTAWFRNRIWVHKMNKRLNNCMVCCIHVRIQWEWTFSVTIKRFISIRSYDPIL